jgi:hypothetical protein
MSLYAGADTPQCRGVASTDSARADPIDWPSGLRRPDQVRIRPGKRRANEHAHQAISIKNDPHAGCAWLPVPVLLSSAPLVLREWGRLGLRPSPREVSTRVPLIEPDEITEASPFAINRATLRVSTPVKFDPFAVVRVAPIPEAGWSQKLPDWIGGELIE